MNIPSVIECVDLYRVQHDMNPFEYDIDRLLKQMRYTDWPNTVFGFFCIQLYFGVA